MMYLCSRDNSNTSTSCLCDTTTHKNKTSVTPTATTLMRSTFAESSKSTIFPDSHFTNHESLPSLPDATAAFLSAYPHYADTNSADRIRDDEYPHLVDHVSLDYTGLGLFSHRHSPPFSISYLKYGAQESPVQSRIRTRIMRFLNLSEDDYTMLCTANRTSAFKLVAEAYPFSSYKNLLTVYDYDSEAITAVVETARRRGGKVVSARFSWPSFRIRSADLHAMITKKRKGLMVFPLQSRTTGAVHPYFWMRLAQENGWHVLLDACAVGAKEMDALGLSLIQPDFVVSSFYRVIGENPSGFATLFIKKSSATVLDVSGTSGGIVSIVSTDDSSFSDEINGESQFEQEPIQCRGLDHADSLGLILISSRIRYLTNWLVIALSKLQHPNSANGHSLVRIYGPRVKFERGASVAFNVFDWKGEKVDPTLVQKLADRSNISLSCSFLQNVCFSEKYEAQKEMVMERKEGGGLGIAVVNASIGFLSNFEDVYMLWSFVAKFLDADFVEKERWRYVALNQRMVEV